MSHSRSRKRHVNRELIEAAWLTGNADTIKQLLEAGANVDCRDPEHNETPLMGAAQRGMLSNVIALLENSPALELTDIYGRTALIHASSAGERGVVELLIARGSLIDHADDEEIRL